MAATQFQTNLAASLPQTGAYIIFSNKTSVIPGIGFTVGSDPQTYPESGIPATQTNGLGSFWIGTQIDATGNNTVDHFLVTLPAPAVLVQATLQQSVIEATGNSTTLQLRKVPTSIAIASGTGLVGVAGATPVNLKTGVVALTVLPLTLSATAGALTFAATDSLAVDFTNAVTEYIGFLSCWFNFI